ncbi:MAG: adenosylcobinamide-GDP ribazoletransferase [Alphaproteobacteria bacterium TMED89]|nr:adenosylcobinamide-GDP ribazoletransferase [Rhodospirillaceae bacterium]RPH14961.1 MAG: adenosylcobinamide-GDP ribazoletransferase [Alphaproteobacteria bacterium TMED89]
MGWREAVGSLSTSFAFLTRIPLPSFLFSDHIPVARAAWAFPVVGFVIGLAQAVVLGLLSGLGWHPAVVAVVVLGGSILLTGALHEDGLGDVADSLGGATRERKLEIMKDSRLGTFGVLALVLMVGLKLTVLMSLSGDAGWRVILAVMVGSGVVSRVLMTLVWSLLPAASTAGLGAERPSSVTALIAVAIGFAILALLVPLSAGLVLVGTVSAGAMAVAFAVFARWQYGGVTGDVCGAAQMLAELAFFGAALSLMA